MGKMLIFFTLRARVCVQTLLKNHDMLKFVEHAVKVQNKRFVELIFEILILGRDIEEGKASLA